MKLNSRYSLHNNGKITERRHGQFVKATPIDVHICESCGRISPKFDLAEENGFVHRVRIINCPNCGNLF